MIVLSLYMPLTRKLASVPNLGTPRITQVPPQSRASIEVRISAGWPTHSKETSTPFGQISLIASMVSTSAALMKWVAPNCLASSSFFGLVSTAMIGKASASAAPWITLRPMPPTPITSTLWPWDTLARLNTAPTPVMTPQPSSEATSKGTSLLIGTAWRAFTTVCSENAPMLANCSTLRSPWRNGADILPIDCRQWVGRPLSQASHAPQFDRVEMTTWSPRATVATAEPTSLTMPTPSCPSTTGVGNGMVPSITDTSLWQTPAAWMSTRTSSSRRSRTVRSVTTLRPPSSNTIPFTGLLSTARLGDAGHLVATLRADPRLRCGSARPDDRLQLAVGMEAEAPAVTTDAAHLEAAEGQLVVALGGVDAHVAGPELLRHGVGPGGVGREDVVVQA